MISARLLQPAVRIPLRSVLHHARPPNLLRSTEPRSLVILRGVHASAEAGAKTAAEAVSVAQEGATNVRGHPQMRLFIIGCPGSGKGTLSARLQKKIGALSIITAGDLLRHHISAGTPLGKQAASIIDHGGLMPDQIMADLVQSELNSVHGQNWMLDGFPRTLGQAGLLDHSLEKAEKPINMMINLQVPSRVILDRIRDRWVHVPSGRVYNISFNPPKVAGHDDVTGEPLTKRPDDTPEVFQTRLDAFHKLTTPILEHYEERAALVLHNDDIAPLPRETEVSGHGAAHAASGRLAARLRSVPFDQLVHVNLAGTTSNAIWPLLERVVDARFHLH